MGLHLDVSGRPRRLHLTMTYSVYGMNDAAVKNCLDRFPFGDLAQIIADIKFYKGQFTFTFNCPPGVKSWKQWLYLNEQYPAMNNLLRALHEADSFFMDDHTFIDQDGNDFAFIGHEKPRTVNFLK